MATGEGFIIRNNPDRVNPDVLVFLESWQLSDWKRRTGYLSHRDGWHYQLREGVVAQEKGEIEFYDFGARYGFSWLNKSDWS